MSRVPTRLVWGGLLLAALLMAGVVSFYASSDPDGLDRVSQDEGFSGTATEHSSSDSPLADYGVAGVEDDRLSGGVAGVVGTGVVLLVMGGVAYGVRRRSDRPDGAPSAPGTGTG